MLKKLFQLLMLLLLRLRYRITIEGLSQILEKGNSSILFLPNHPALIDPVIVMSLLYADFKPRPLVDEEQVEKKWIRCLMKHMNAVLIPDLKKEGLQGRQSVIEGVNDISNGLHGGDNILLYPAGRIYRSRYESIGANSSIELVLLGAPEARVVLVRTSGLWGSSFSRATGQPSLTANIKMFVLALFSSGLFFMPKREVHISFVEPVNFPKLKSKMEINLFLEYFYNRASKANCFVPYFWWQGRKARIVAEPETESEIQIIDISHIPEVIKALVLEKLQALSGVSVIHQNDDLAQDLGMDSLLLVEFTTWLERDLEIRLTSLDGINSVAHCVLAAAGELHSEDGVVPKKTEVPL